MDEKVEELKTYAKVLVSDKSKLITTVRHRHLKMEMMLCYEKL